MTAPAGTWAPFRPTAQHVRVVSTGRPTRRLVILFDQHKHRLYHDGRAWWGFAERQANPDAMAPGVVGELIPVASDSPLVVQRKQAAVMVKGWQAPWYPPSAYVNRGIDLADGLRLDILYREMVADYKLAEREYYNRAVLVASQNSLPVPQLGDRVDFRVQAIAGRPPMSPRVPEAAISGNPWLLGFADDREADERLQRLVDPDADREALQRAAREMERHGARISDDVSHVSALEAQVALLQRQMAEMTEAFRAATADGTEILVTHARRRAGRPRKGADASAAPSVAETDEATDTP